MKRSVLIAVVLVQTLVLLFMIAKKQYTLNTGTEIVLEIEPVDPRSLFRGDYVQLNYAINTLRSSAFPEIVDFQPHATIFVRLRPGEPFWQPVSVHHHSPDLQDGEVAIRGRVKAVNRPLAPPEAGPEAESQLHITYGIESYFVPEGEGRELERSRQRGQVSLRIAVDRFGNAGIKAVLVDGEPRYVEKLF